MRRKTRAVHVKNMTIGGDAPISIQSMTNRPAKDFAGTIEQIQSLAAAGCEIVRVAVPDIETAAVFSQARKAGITVPLVADIHFDYRIALEAVRRRQNPDQSWQHRQSGSGARGCRCLQKCRRSHPHWRKRRFPGKITFGKARRSHSGCSG